MKDTLGKRERTRDRTKDDKGEGRVFSTKTEQRSRQLKEVSGAERANKLALRGYRGGRVVKKIHKFWKHTLGSSEMMRLNW